MKKLVLRYKDSDKVEVGDFNLVVVQSLEEHRVKMYPASLIFVDTDLGEEYPVEMEYRE